LAGPLKFFVLETRMSLRAAISSFLVALAAVSVCWSAEKTAGKPQGHTPNTGIECIETTLADFVRCFTNGDTKGLAELWKADGHFVTPSGERIDGRVNIEAAFKTFFAAHKNCKMRLTIVERHRVTDDVTVVEALAEMSPVPEGPNDSPQSTVILVRSEGRWQIESIRETVAAVPSPFGHLKELGWLVGEWTGTLGGSADVSLHGSCDWTANGSFLIRKFSIRGKAGVGMAGTEVIGWDPRTHRIRSWIFETDGGFGRSEWTRDGDRWTIKYTGVLPDGSDVSATRVLSRVNADTLTVQSTERRMNGQKRPNIAAMTIKRVSPKDAPKPQPTKLPRQVLP
jgi:uncharacterized protein (TIGR02246 family)